MPIPVKIYLKQRNLEKNKVTDLGDCSCMQCNYEQLIYLLFTLYWILSFFQIHYENITDSNNNYWHIQWHIHTCHLFIFNYWVTVRICLGLYYHTGKCKCCILGVCDFFFNLGYILNIFNIIEDTETVLAMWRQTGWPEVEHRQSLLVIFTSNIN